MNKLRVLIAHNRYRQQGGEDIVADQEASMLEQRGHQVMRFTRDNRELREGRLQTALETVWSRDTLATVSGLIKEFRPDVIHAHNTFPLISPTLYWAAAAESIPVVQTLHNFRMLCPQGMLLREGRVCEACIGQVPWRAVVHSCYRESSLQSAVTATMLSLHRVLGTYRNKVTRYIALNKFCRDKFVAGGIPAEKIAVKPNFADIDPPDSFAARDGALFVGRLSQEKGIDVLLEALAFSPSQRITVIGDGPESLRVAHHSRVTLRGRLAQPDIFTAMRRHRYLVLPSIWYENAPRTLIEAFGCGLPVIASRIGALAELIRERETGLLFDASSAASLANAMAWATAHPEEMLRMGRNARCEFETHYTADRNYPALLDIYRDAVDAPLAAERYEEVAS